MYRAYLWTTEGKQLPGYVEIDEDPAAIMQYFQVQAPINPTVVVTDQQDNVVAKMQDRKLVYPEVEHEIDFGKKAAN